jgi:hypothetical protein
VTGKVPGGFPPHGQPHPGSKLLQHEYYKLPPTSSTFNSNLLLLLLLLLLLSSSISISPSPKQIHYRIRNIGNDQSNWTWITPALIAAPYFGRPSGHMSSRLLYFVDGARNLGIED